MRVLTALVLGLLLQAVGSSADDDRAQYPPYLANSYFGVGAGYIDYSFSQRLLEPGFQAESIKIPHGAGRVVLLGHEFNRYLAAQVVYIRPAQWVSYQNINGIQAGRSVWMNIGGLTLRGSLPLGKQLFLDAEAGGGVVTRHGFSLEGIPTVRDASYWTVLLGGGLRYRLNESWDLDANATYSPSEERVRQPRTLMFSAGFTRILRPLPEDRVRENTNSGFIFPRNLVQVGYSTDFAGFQVNKVVSGGGVPIFWGGLAQVEGGFTLRYQRNVFHTRRVFSFDLGVSAARWKSRFDGAGFYTASMFPEFRFTPLHMGGADLYFNYSLAGPTTISRATIDGNDTGRHFTFQDFMGMGIYAGKTRRWNAEIQIGHYSNGNLFPQNAGVSIPLTFMLGYTFH
jgi:hypothetical protein